MALLERRPPKIRIRVGKDPIPHFMNKLVYTAIACLCVVAYSEAQSLSPWEVNAGEGMIPLPANEKSRKGTDRLPSVYKYANIPDKKDAGWKPVPTPGGKVAYSTTSILDKANYDKFTQLDFTYFRAYLDLPTGFKLDKATVTIGNVDDQARMMVFNSLHPSGYYVEANDGKRGGVGVITDFTSQIAVGEVNTFVIVQVDDNCCGNNLTGGITVQINNQVQSPATDWKEKHPEFLKSNVYIDLNNLRAYSINGGGYSDSEPYAVTNENGVSVIRTLGKMSANDAYFNIKKVPVGTNMVAFQVVNMEPNTYLTLSGSSEANNRITTRKLSTIPDEAKYYEEPPLFNDTNQKGFNSYRNVKFGNSYLRHQGLYLEIDPKETQDLYKKDASWRIEKLR